MVSPILRGNPFALELRLAPAGSVWAEQRNTRMLRRNIKSVKVTICVIFAYQEANFDSQGVRVRRISSFSFYEEELLLQRR